MNASWKKRNDVRKQRRMKQPDEFTNSVWCLIYSMIETGIDGSEPWWGQDFLHVKALLEAKGLNCNPERIFEDDRA